MIAPPYFAFAAGELLEHFAAAAAACAPLPFYLYEYAERSGYAVPVAVVEELRERAPNLAGMKVSDAPFERIEPYLATGLDVFIGAEGAIRQGLANGAAGAVSGVAAAFPEAVSVLVRDPTPERAALAEALRRVLSEHPFQASVKAALGFRGVPVRPDVRGPLQPLPAHAAERLRSELEHGLALPSAQKALHFSTGNCRAFVINERRAKHPLPPLHIVWDLRAAGRTSRSGSPAQVYLVYFCALPVTCSRPSAPLRPRPESPSCH